MTVNEEGLDKNKSYLYAAFPSRLNSDYIVRPREIRSYTNDESSRGVH